MISWLGLMNDYKPGMENLILSPLAAFFIEENLTSHLWFILVLPKCESDLETFKHQFKPDENDTKLILKTLAKALFYLSRVRNIRHQDSEVGDHDQTENSNQN